MVDPDEPYTHLDREPHTEEDPPGEEHLDAYQREERLTAEETAPHPEIVPSTDPHHGMKDEDYDAWLKEQEEIYRKEHAHLFGDKVDSEETSEESQPEHPPKPKNSQEEP
jgi:hypothetical protein